MYTSTYAETMKDIQHDRRIILKIEYDLAKYDLLNRKKAIKMSQCQRIYENPKELQKDHLKRNK